jgi:tRNA (adenine-N(1)-)-methyltransferase non-catalytic subunit
MDTIAQILTYANLASFRNVLVLESCKGLLLASVVERLGGNGTVVNLSPNGSHIASK